MLKLKYIKDKEVFDMERSFENLRKWSQNCMFSLIGCGIGIAIVMRILCTMYDVTTDLCQLMKIFCVAAGAVIFLHSIVYAISKTRRRF